jgi:hypothetical protein
VTLDDLWSDWGASSSWWWQGGVGYDHGAQTWTDRKASIVASVQALGAVSAVTVAGQSAVRVTSTNGAHGLETASNAALALATYREFLIVAPSAGSGGNSGILYRAFGGDGAFLWAQPSLGGSLAGVGDGTNYSVRDGVATDDASRVGFSYAAMTDPQAAQFESDLLTIMGL